MVEALVALGVLRGLPTGQHASKLIGDAHGVDHLVVAITRVHIHTMYLDLAASGVEVLILQLAYCAAIHGISEVATELLHIKVVGTLTNLFVWRKAHANLTVLNLRVLD